MKKRNKNINIYQEELRVVFYARVSTGSDEQVNSLENQIDYYTNFISRNPEWTFAGQYVDKGISGKSVKNRSGFLDMIKDASLDKFDLIVTKEISRFSRNLVDSLKYTKKLLRYGVGVLFESENLCTFLSQSDQYLGLLGTMAQAERSRIADRVQFGFNQAIENSVVLGNNHIWGYRKDKGRLVIDEREATIVKRIFEIYAFDNIGIRRICDLLNSGKDEDLEYLGKITNKEGNPLTFTTIRGIIANPKYKGFYCGRKTERFEENDEDDPNNDDPIIKIKPLPIDQWRMFKDETGEIVPAIVSEELWNRANALLMERREAKISKTTSYQNRYSYSGKIVCGEHGTRYQHAFYHYKSGTKEIWQCKLYYEKGKIGCGSPIVYTTELDEVVKAAVQTVIQNRTHIIDEMIEMYSHVQDIPNQKKKKEDFDKEIKAINRKAKILLDNLLDGTITKEAFKERNGEFNARIADLEKQLLELQKDEQKTDDLKINLEKLRNTIDMELNFKDGLPASIVDSLLDRIEVYKTDDPKTVKLKVYFRIIGGDDTEYEIRRIKRGVTSVCSISSI